MRESLETFLMLCRINKRSGLVKGVAQAPNIDPEDINVMIATNVTGLINMTQAVLSVYKKRDQGGRGDIINIGSIAGREPYSGGSIYCATKAAVRSFTDSLRKELISTRIRVIEIDPGQVETVYPRPYSYLHLRMNHSNMLIRIGILRCPLLRRQGQGRRRLCVRSRPTPQLLTD